MSEDYVWLVEHDDDYDAFRPYEFVFASVDAAVRHLKEDALNAGPWSELRSDPDRHLISSSGDQPWVWRIVRLPVVGTEDREGRLVEAARAAVEAFEPFLSAWEAYEPWTEDGEKLHADLVAALAAYPSGS